MYANDPSIHIKKIKEQKAEERNNKTNINEIWKCEKSKNKTKPKLFFLKKPWNWQYISKTDEEKEKRHQ